MIGVILESNLSQIRRKVVLCERHVIVHCKGGGHVIGDGTGFGEITSAILFGDKFNELIQIRLVVHMIVSPTILDGTDSLLEALTPWLTRCPINLWHDECGDGVRVERRPIGIFKGGVLLIEKPHVMGETECRSRRASIFA